MQDEVTAIKRVVARLLAVFIRTGIITDEEPTHVRAQRRPGPAGALGGSRPRRQARLPATATSASLPKELFAGVQCDLGVPKRPRTRRPRPVDVCQILAANAEAVAALEALGVTPTEAKSPDVTKLTLDQLRAFNRVRVSARSTLCGAEFKVSPAKGNLADAQQLLAHFGRGDEHRARTLLLSWPTCATPT